MPKNENVASVLAFEKKLAPSDGYMYGAKWEKRDQKDSINPLKLQEKSVRGTISNRFKHKDLTKFAKDPAKLDANVESANLQTVDVCALELEQDTLKIHFTLKILGGISEPSACNNHEFKKSYAKAVKNYIERENFKELAKRYAINIANARFLWRNRVGAEKIEVLVTRLNSDTEHSWKFDATHYSTRNFEATDTQIDSLAEQIARVLSSENDFLMLDITCFAKIGRGQEVYPSQELVLDKGKIKKTKVLYSVNNVAAMHSQKIGNALRTIDTWYSEFNDETTSAGPIAIEPYGTVTNLGKAFRNPKDKQDFYTFFDKFARDEELQNIEDDHYVMAVLVRGGVFGKSDKDK